MESRQTGLDFVRQESDYPSSFSSTEIVGIADISYDTSVDGGEGVDVTKDLLCFSGGEDESKRKHFDVIDEINTGEINVSFIWNMIRYFSLTLYQECFILFLFIMTLCADFTSN